MTNCTHTEGDCHDCTYVQAVNALIPRAQQMACELVGESSPEYARVFIDCMQNLCVANGLRKHSPRG